MDPVLNYSQRLMHEEVLDKTDLKKLKKQLEKEMEDALAFAEESPLPALDDYIKSIKDL